MWALKSPTLKKKQNKKKHKESTVHEKRDCLDYVFWCTKIMTCLSHRLLFRDLPRQRIRCSIHRQKPPLNYFSAWRFRLFVFPNKRLWDGQTFAVRLCETCENVYDCGLVNIVHQFWCTWCIESANQRSICKYCTRRHKLPITSICYMCLDILMKVLRYIYLKESIFK